MTKLLSKSQHCYQAQDSEHSLTIWCLVAMLIQVQLCTNAGRSNPSFEPLTVFKQTLHAEEQGSP